MRSCMTLKASTITVGMPGRPRRAEELPLQRCVRRRTGRAGRVAAAGVVGRRVVVLVGAVAGDGGAAAEQVGIEVDRDHQPRAERARRRDRHRIDQRAVDQPAPADAHRREDARQRIGGAQRLGQASAREPDFMAGAEFGGDRGKAQRQLVDRGVGRAPLRAGRRDGCRRSGRSPTG